MAAVGRFLLIIALMASPWWFGCVQPWPQFLLASVIGGLVILRAVQAVVQRPDGSIYLPLAGVAPLVLLLVAAIQLLPRDVPPSAHMNHAIDSETARLFEGPDYVATGTLSPASTRSESARLYFALAAFLLAAQWFAAASTHRALLGALALNGAALGAFGIVQSLSWNGMLYWTYDLRFGGTPFASFVNRNNAAGYLNLCLGAAIGLGVLTLGSQPSIGQPLTKLSDRVRYLISRVDGRHVAILGLLALIVAAQMFSMSRGGVVAMVVSGACVGFLGFRRTNRIALLMVGVGVVAAAVGLLAYAGQFDAVGARLDTLGDPMEAASGRLQHWQDTIGAVYDFPIIGTGLGTYRYANLPYQAHPAHAWYYNADNEWFEILVETGFVGLIAALGGMLLIGICAMTLLRRQDAASRAIGAAGLFVVLSQSIQAVTDFGLIIPSNGITFAVLAGAVCGAACRAAEFEQIRIPPALCLARLEGRPSQALLGISLAVAGCAFLLELFASTSADAARDHKVELDREDTPMAAIDAAIDRATRVLSFRPDDGELHLAIGDLYADRYRLQLYRQEMERAPEASGPQRQQLWRATSLTTLALHARQLEASGNHEALTAVRSHGPVAQNLPTAWGHYRQALRYCSLIRGGALRLSRLEFFSSKSISERDAVCLAKARFVAPSTPSTLMELAALAAASDDKAFAAECWRRCLEVSPDESLAVWNAASQVLSEQEVIDTVLPDRMDVLVTIGEGLSGQASRDRLIHKAENVLERSPAAISALERGQLAELQSEIDTAIEQYRLALSAQPWESRARLRLARLLHRQGRLEDAEREYSLLPQQLRNRKDIEDELSALRLEAAEHRLHSGPKDGP